MIIFITEKEFHFLVKEICSLVGLLISISIFKLEFKTIIIIRKKHQNSKSHKKMS